MTTIAASSIGGTYAYLNGSGIPNGADTTGWVQYSTVNPTTCSTTFGSRVPTSGGTDLSIGYSAVPYSEYVSGLTPETTYYYCAEVSNAYGTALGAILSFTTTAIAPTVTTGGVTSLTGSTAVLNATGNPGGAATTGWFRYATASPGTCNGTFGTALPSTGGSSLGSGIATVSYSQTATGLTAGTTYYYCAIDSNSLGTVYGSVLSFTTPVPPTVTTSSSISIANNYVYLYGTVNPNNASTTAWFQYGTTNPTTCSASFGTASGTYGAGAGATAISYDLEITGLTPDTTYYYCAIASNNAGTSVGAVLSFTTAAPPVLTTAAATTVTSSSAVLNGAGTPNGADTSGWFGYSTTNPGTCTATFGTRLPASGGTDLSTGFSPVNYAQTLTGLTPSTTYYYCAIGSNTYGTAWGTVLSFTTLAAAPTVTTVAASNLAPTTAQLNGSANPEGADTTGWFRYSTTNPTTCNNTFGTAVPATGGMDVGAGISAVSYSEPLTGLTAGTTYYFCALVSNSIGTAVGSVLSFTTPLPPTVVTSYATSITNTSAYLYGTANPNNATTTAWFRYAITNPGTCNNTFGSLAPTTGSYGVGSGTSAVTYDEPITGLSPSTIYYFCAIANNAEGTAFGSILTFETQAPSTVTTGSATTITSSSAVLNGLRNSERRRHDGLV